MSRATRTPDPAAALSRRDRRVIGADARLVVAAVALAVCAVRADAQFARGTYPIDIGSSAPLPRLPFDEQFVLTGTAAPELIRTVIWWDRADQFPGTMCDSITANAALRGATANDVAAQLSQWRGWRQVADLARRGGGRRPATSAAGAVANAGTVAPVAAPARPAVIRPDSADMHGPKPSEKAAYRLGSSTLRVADWTRRDTVAKAFTVRAGPLDPNVDYTFCVQSARRFNAAEKAAFQGEVAAALSTTLRPFVDDTIKKLNDLTDLRELQKALARAVPRRDVVIFLDDDALLKPRTPDAEADSVRLRRDTLMLVRVLSLHHVASERRNRLQDIATTRSRLDSGLLAIARHPALGSLPRATADIPRQVAYRLRYQETGRLALRMQGGSRAAFSRVGMGATPLDRADAGVPEMSFVGISDTAALAAVRTNLERTSDLLRDLRELTTAVRDSLWRLPPGVAQPAALDSLLLHVRDAESQTTIQRRNVARLGPEIVAVQSFINALAQTVSAIDLGDAALVGSSATTYEDNATRYVSVDLGVLGAFGVPGLRKIGGRDFAGGAASPYLGVNFYFRPINKRAALSECTSECWWLRRISLTVGITTNSLKRTGVREDLFASQNVVVAVGYRLSDYFRAVGGALLFKSIAPATGGERVTATPAGGLSLDWDIRSTLGPVLGKLFPNTGS